MCSMKARAEDAQVALLAEGVDRNNTSDTFNKGDLVALLAEGVDRNGWWALLPGPVMVALLAEGVDRNKMVQLVKEG